MPTARFPVSGWDGVAWPEPGIRGSWTMKGGDSHVTCDSQMASWVTVTWNPSCGQTEWQTGTTEKKFVANSLGFLNRDGSEPTSVATLTPVGCNLSHVNLSFAFHVGKILKISYESPKA